MKCAWNGLLGILPQWLRPEVDKLGRESLQELRLRNGAPPELVLSDSSYFLSRKISADDLSCCINSASKYSPWAASTSAKGYITAPGGHRIGLCGSAVICGGTMSGIRELQSICIRVARDLPGIAKSIQHLNSSILILGAPGWGKTTLLRDLSRQISERHTLSVIDERLELFPTGIARGRRMDVLSGCPKLIGIEMLLRTMGPEYIAVDEITAPEDCEALIQAANCGVHLIATAHAASLYDFRNRKTYQHLINQDIFSHVILLKPDKTYTCERMNL